MAAMEPLFHLFGLSHLNLSPYESLILEAELFINIYDELLEIYKSKMTNFSIITEKENNMLETTCLQFIINDIFLSEQYSLEGIAYETQIPEELLCDIITGKNHFPSLQLSRKIIELHKTVRPKLYKEILERIISKYLSKMNPQK